MTQDVLIFRTNINTLEKVKKTDQLLSKHKGIQRWNIDLEDCDKVLRVETAMLQKESVIGILKSHEIFCEEMD
jgi:tRNA(Ser,Leu) C12 N-acetylase TAN1